ncbi:MAG: hypothetical protein ACRDY4_09035 [Acidimicrobiia bacterium]
MSWVESGREVAKRLALARMAVGVAGLLMPRTFGRAWVGDEAASPRIAMITRAFAVRDLALGLGAYLAVQKEAPVRGWLEAGLLSDATDVLSTLRGPVPAGRKLMVVAAAMVAVSGGAMAMQNLEDATLPAPV